jgi:phosphate transport system permease protein
VRSDRIGDRVLFGLCAAAGVLVLLTLVGIAYQVVNNASPAIDRFGLGFLVHTAWIPNFNVYGAGAWIFGTLVTSLVALAVATPLGIAIGLYLAVIARPGVRAVVGPLVEMLAAIPSVILGFWGIIVFAPFIQQHVEPALHGALGFIPLFGSPQTTGLSIFTASLVLTLMILPIISALSRDLFLTVPQDLTDAASALGSTRWEIIRGVILPTTSSGVAAATVLALGRALGEAIAVAQVIGDGSGIHASLFSLGATLASRVALDFQQATGQLLSALFYLAVVLMVISLLTTLAARAVAGRFDVERSYARAVGV